MKNKIKWVCACFACVFQFMLFGFDNGLELAIGAVSFLYFWFTAIATYITHKDLFK